MKKSEIFYFDVDGTILDNSVQKISEKTIKAINKLQEQGYKIAIATGRTSAALNNPEIQSVCEWDGYVLGNGGSIMDKDFKIVKEHLCEPEFVHNLINLYPGAVVLEGYNNYVINDMSKELRAFFGEGGNALEEISQYDDQPVHKIIVEDLNLIPGGIDNPIFENYTYHMNTANMPEIFPKDSGKHIAVAELNEILGVTSFAYFGDGHNDVDAIKAADFGVAMGNAAQEAKDIADFTTSSVAEDGVVHALKHFKLI